MAGVNLHIYPNSIQFESRMLRMTGSVAAAGLFDRIDLVGMAAPDLPGVETLDEMRRIVRLPVGHFWRRGGGVGRILELLAWNRVVARKYRDEPVTMVNPHIVWALPVASWLRARHGTRVIYDTHELETETVGSRGVRKHLSRFVEQRYVGHVDAVHVVSEGIARWYRHRYGLRSVHTIKNYPLTGGRRESTRIFRERFGIPDNHLVFCYQGRLSRVPEIELLLDVFRRVPEDRHLVFMGFGPQADRLRVLAETAANLHFHPGVPFDEVPSHTGSADVALVLFDDTCLSYHHVLPNKLLESLNAGIPVICSDLPDMVAEIQEDDAGWIVQNDVESLAALVGKLDHEQIARKRAGACSWAARNDWSVMAEKMLAVYREVLAS